MSVDDYIEMREKQEARNALMGMALAIVLGIACWYGIYKLTAWLWEKI